MEIDAPDCERCGLSEYEHMDHGTAGPEKSPAACEQFLYRRFMVFRCGSPELGEVSGGLGDCAANFDSVEQAREWIAGLDYELFDRVAGSMVG